MVKQEQIRQSKEIQRRTGKTFHLATRVLPERVRHETYVLYAFFRVADEVVDAVDTAPPEEQRRRLEELRRQALGEEDADDPVLTAFAELRETHNIPASDVDVFIDAMLSDIDTDRYETYEELEAYMDGSAAAVGRMMTQIMETPQAEQALPHATALGEAFQLSNFLRDVREDVVERDRIYLPQETLRKHGVTEEQILNFEFDENFQAAMREELQRAEALYREGVEGIKYLPEDCQFAVLLAAVLYADHHHEIRTRDCDVLSTTPSLSTSRKLYLLAKTRLYWALERDPVAVFRRVSVVPYPDESETTRDSGHSGPSPGRTTGSGASRWTGGRVSGWLRSFTRSE
ncbi:phytoene/squalene synthase family protein [Halobellus inordinatus]|uniref:phytoene/squalene synthase family protein n=1 Tax=Halobellus inordinatus TaxID=1126236 RepID=UPI0021142B2E|nr:phytoene/squalene synthase family protein [Halobellus ramosii]